MIAIRKATPNDMNEMCRMARAMHNASPDSLNTCMDIRSFAETVANLSTNGSSAVFIAETNGKACGMIAVMAVDLWHDKECLIGQEAFWWVDEEHRVGHHAWKSLLKAAERWSMEIGCRSYRMSSSSDLPQDRLAVIYNKWGYDRKSIIYVKEL